MEKGQRNLQLQVCNYKKENICSLYDSLTDISGQATDITVTTERNGWKELSFSIPSVIETDQGRENNYRLDFLKTDYLIKIIDGSDIDFFIISQSSIFHDNYSKNVNVTAGHISQLLKVKNLGLEFSDSEGNNIGNARQLAETILEGTGWKVGYVHSFKDKDGKEKTRSLVAPSKTGAFSLLEKMCDLFEAKPVFHGNTKIVDILPLNPFSKVKKGNIPDLSLSSDVLELHYGTNIKSLKRDLNSEDIVTKLYAYGSYGDKTSGYCGLDECVHFEYKYVLSSDCAIGQAYHFKYKDYADIEHSCSFIPSTDMKPGDVLIYSLLDPASMMYIWNDTQKIAYIVFEKTEGSPLPCSSSIDKNSKNWFQFIMDFDYYRDIGLLTDDMLLKIANYQKIAPEKYQKVAEASKQMSDAQTELSETIGVIDYCKLDVLEEDLLSGHGYISLKLNKEIYPDGVIYRTDYYERPDNYFKWIVGDSLNKDGDPENPATSVLYVLHQTNPISWEKMFLKDVDDKDNPTVLTFWAKANSVNFDFKTDKFFLFSHNGINGYLGSLEAKDEAALKALNETTKVVTTQHPVIFTEKDPALISIDDFVEYAWLWKYSHKEMPSEMYFCSKVDGDTSWNFVYFQDTDPGGAENRSYWYNWRTAILYRRDRTKWIALNSSDQLNNSVQKRIASKFSSVYMLSNLRDKYYKGVFQSYTYEIPVGESLPIGNYYFEDPFKTYTAFTTTEELGFGDKIVYDTSKNWIKQYKNNVETLLAPKNYKFDNVDYHPLNALFSFELEDGTIDSSGKLVPNSNAKKGCRTPDFFKVIPGTKYHISGLNHVGKIHFYNNKKRWISSSSISNSFVTTSDMEYFKLSFDEDKSFMTDFPSSTIQADNVSKTIIISNVNYVKLHPLKSQGMKIGLHECFLKFSNMSDLVYIDYYSNLINAQNEIKKLENDLMESIGDLYREGWWQNPNYVDGDEDRLYSDAWDNIEQISRPNAKYSIKYLDLFRANYPDFEYGSSDLTTKTDWPDISISCAVHLLDPDIKINTWAFLDKVVKCYDKPWDTSISINTNMSTIAQHSFTDVMSNIANVANTLKVKESYYDYVAGNSVSSDSLKNSNIINDEKFKDVINFKDSISDVEINIDKTINKIQATENDIVAEKNRSTEVEGELSSRIIMNANAIQTEVSRASAAEGQLNSTITQTAEGIRSEASSQVDSAVSGAKTELNTTIQQTADGIKKEFNKNISDSITESENSITESLTTKITETASGIKTELSQKITDDISASETRTDTKITESAQGIKVEVSKQITDDVSSAEQRLNTSLTQTAEGIRTEITSKVDTDIKAERDRATAAESSLSTTITETASGLKTEVTQQITSAVKTETDRATGKETELGTSISGEVERATNAEKELGSSITQTAEGIRTEVTEKINTDIAAERDRAIGVENTLSTSITQTASGIRTEVTKEINTAVSAETSRATQKETDLDTSISNEATRATGKEAELDTAISDEVTRASGAEATLGSSITQTAEQIHTSVSKEITDAISASETKTGTTIAQTAESIRTAVTQEITDSVGAEKTRAEKAESTLTQTATNIQSSVSDISTKITQEIDRATKAEQNLNTTITQTKDSITQTVTKTVTETVSKDITAANQKITAAEKEIENAKTSITNEISRADEAEKAIEAKVTEETTRAQTQETKIDQKADGIRADVTKVQTAITTEADRAIAAEAKLQSSIDVTESTITQKVTKTVTDTVTESITAVDNKVTTAQQAIEANTSGLASANKKIGAVETGLGKEEERALAAEGSLDTKISNEVSKEETRALAAESVIDQKADNISLKVTTNEQNIIKEADRATKAEKELGASITATENSITQRVTETVTNTVTESITAVDNKVGTLETNLGSTNTKVGTLETNLGTTNENLGNLETNLGTTNENLGTLETNLGVTNQNLDNTNKSLTEINGKLQEEITRATTKEAEIIQTANGITSRVETVEGSVDTISKSSIISQTADAIKAVVRDKDENNEFHTSSVSMDKNGISVSTGGAVDIQAGGSFTVDSANFDVSPDGILTASGVNISGTLYSDQAPVLTKNDIVISQTKPVGRLGMLWIRPMNKEEIGPEPPTPPTPSVPSSATVNFSDWFDPGNREYIGGSADASSLNVVISGTPTECSGTNFTFSASVPIYIQQYNKTKYPGYKTGCKLHVKISSNGRTLTFVKNIKGGTEISYGGHSIIFSNAEIDSGSSNVWWGNSSSVNVKVWATDLSGYHKGNILNNRGTVSFTCSAQ